MSAKIKLTDKDWGLLLPTESFTLGTTKLYLRPIGIDEISKVLGVLDESKEYLLAQNITMKNYHEPLQLIAITKLVVDKLPLLLSDCTELDIDDIKKLPLEVSVELVTALISINEKSKEGLIKNLTALADKVANLISIGELETPPTSSSKKATPGQK